MFSYDFLLYLASLSSFLSPNLPTAGRIKKTRFLIAIKSIAIWFYLELVDSINNSFLYLSSYKLHAHVITCLQITSLLNRKVDFSVPVAS